MCPTTVGRFVIVILHKNNKLHSPADFKRFGVRLESNLVVKSIHEALALVANVDVSDYFKLCFEMLF